MTDTAFYTGLRETADDLLTDYGQTMTLTSVVAPSDYNPADGDATNTETDYPVTGALIDIASEQVDGTTIFATDQRILLSAEGLSVTPKADDNIVVSSASYKIIRVKPINPGGIAVVYDIIVRK